MRKMFNALTRPPILTPRIHGNHWTPRRWGPKDTNFRFPAKENIPSTVVDAEQTLQNAAPARQDETVVGSDAGSKPPRLTIDTIMKAQNSDDEGVTNEYEDSSIQSSCNESPPPSAPPQMVSWQGASLGPRDALIRIFVNEAQYQQTVIDTLKESVQRTNEAIAKSHAPSQKGPIFEHKAPQRPIIPHASIKAALVKRLQWQEFELNSRIRRAKQEYQARAKRWQEHCKMLDAQNPPDEPPPPTILETPLTSRTGRRRGGVSDMMYSEFDLEQFMQKQAENDKVDAELLGRTNAAEIPDMIAVTPACHSAYRFDDTNRIVYDPNDFYDYWVKDAWTEEEEKVFFQLLNEVGKKFGTIASHPTLKHKTVQDCVRFYYREKADDKYRALAQGTGKKKGKRHESASASGVGGLLGDIRAEEKKGHALVAEEDENNESSDSAYEQEEQSRRDRKSVV